MGMFDSLFGSTDSGAQDYLKQALQAYQNINVPSIAEEQVTNLPQETVQGTVNPEDIQVDKQGDTEFNNISLDPASRQAQMNALAGFSDIANAGGLDANAKLGIQEAVDRANAQSRGDQGAIMKSAQAMGQGGGDFALTQRAIASQGASNTAANSGMQQAAEAEANREAALNGMANIGGQINSSDYNQAANQAASQNAINASNTAAMNAANTGNVANKMNSSMFNVNNAQNVNANNTNANQGNVYYNAGLPQQQFNNEMAKAGGQAGVNFQQANAAQQASQNQANMGGQLLKGGLTLGATAMGGPVARMVASQGLNSGTNYNAPAYKQNAAMNNPNAGWADGGMIPEQCYAEGGMAHNHYMCMLMGGAVPGKAPVAGDSKKNDIVDAKLSPGEIVIKRSKASDPDKAAAEAKKISMESFTKGYKKGRK